MWRVCITSSGKKWHYDTQAFSDLTKAEIKSYFEGIELMLND